METNRLQDRFKQTDWSMFAIQATTHSQTDIESYASSVMDLYLHHHRQRHHPETNHHIPQSEALDEQECLSTAVGPQQRFQIWRRTRLQHSQG